MTIELGKLREQVKACGNVTPAWPVRAIPIIDAVPHLLNWIEDACCELRVMRSLCKSNPKIGGNMTIDMLLEKVKE